MINQNQVALAKKLLESKGYEVSKKMTESPNYSGHDVSGDLQSYLVTVVIGNSDGDRETGMTEPESYTELVSAMDEDDAKRQVEKGLNPGNGVVDVHLATEEEIAEWESDEYAYLDEAHTVELYKTHTEEPERKRFSDYEAAKEFADSKTDQYEEILITIPTANGPSTVNSWSKSDGWYRTFESLPNDYYYLRDIIDTWNIVEKYNLHYTDSPEGIRVSKEDYDTLMKSVKNPRYLRGLIRNVRESRKMEESTSVESHEGWEYYEMPKDFKGPWTAAQYTKDVDGLYLTIYPPQKVPGTTDEESKDWHAEVERADGKSDSINTYQIGFSSFEDAEKWVNDWIASHKKPMNESSDKTPHTEQYRGYSIQSYDDYGATIYKNGKKIREFENIDDAREYIDELKESKKTRLAKVRESRELDYKDMQYWNPVAIGNEIAEYLGVEATEEEIKAELSKIIPDTKSPKFQRALEKALLKIEMDKESMNEDPMQGHNYLVSGNTSNVTETGTDRNIYDGGYTEDPREAIITWLKLSQKAPTSVSIDTNKNAAADELLAWVVDNEEEFRDLCAQYKAPYKVDYLVDACKKGNRHDFEKGKYRYPDQVHPFSIG